jgi:alpha-tubulin suppressor-like RCC1 family protein
MTARLVTQLRFTLLAMVVLAAFCATAHGSRIAAGGGHTCAVLPNGSVSCWGDGASGQLGSGAMVDSDTPVTVIGLSGASEIATGNAHSCAALADGRVECWGNDSSAQLGDGSTHNSSLPVAVRGITTATAVSAGSVFSCALLASGRVKCWGSDYNGEVGNGESSERLQRVPVFVSGLTHAVAITSSSGHSCALLANGLVKCWGSDPYGQLGYETPRAITMKGVTGATAVAAGGGAIPDKIAENDSEFTCAVVRHGRVLCWGDDRAGQLGAGDTRASRAPIEVAGVSGATQIAAGVQHACVTERGGVVQCWGDDRAGEVGDGSIGRRSAPTVVTGLTAATEVTAGGNFGSAHSCAVLADSSVKCWGNNRYGQLGDGTTTGSPEPVTALLPSAPSAP